MLEKIDFKKQDKAFYSGKVGQFNLLDIPEMTFLSLDGMGELNDTNNFPSIVAALYGLSYALKFHCKQTLGKDHVVPPMDGLWWADDMGSFARREKSKWKWRIMLRQPDWISDEIFTEVLENVIPKTAKKKNAATDEATLRAVRKHKITEGLCVQILHIGSYDEEGPVLADMHDRFIPENNLEMTGLHHEIYLSDPRKVPPEKLKTLLRQPVVRV